LFSKDKTSKLQKIFKDFFKKAYKIFSQTNKSKYVAIIKSADRKFFVLIHDVIVAFMAVPIALWLRVGGAIGNYSDGFITKHAVVHALIALGIFLWIQLYRGIWRYVSSNELITIGLASVCVTVLYSPLMLLMNQHMLKMPRSIIPLSCIIMFLALGGSRFAYRLFYERVKSINLSNHSSVPESRVLLIGATNQAEMFIRDVLRSPVLLYDVIGIVDTKKGRVGRYIHGVEIIGMLEDLPQIIEQLNIDGMHPHHLVIADQSMRDQRKISQLLEFTSNNKIDLARLPTFDQFSKPGPHGLEIKPIQIEDLLGRHQVGLDRSSMSEFVRGKRVMVTGAGGTIGCELARQISAFEPESLTMLDNSEYLLYTIDLEISETYPKLKRNVVLADVTNGGAVDDAFAAYKPHIIFHAAALKHVPMAQNHPYQAVLTNVIGTRNITESAQKHRAQSVIFISTDKAVRPTSVMGATKRIAECLCQSLDASSSKSGKTRFITTRFGNVLGSTGSVVPLFRRQLSAGGPLTVTHPDVTRYFMTVKEAVELVLEAAVLGSINPKTMGQIFVLDMGEPVKIIHLAEQMIKLAGLKPYEDIHIEITGLRPGEKLYEELFLDKEHLIKTTCAGLMLASPNLEKLDVVLDKIKQLENVAIARDNNKCQELLASIIRDHDMKMASVSKKVPRKKSPVSEPLV
jgi:FlaA1/EpsC-like NDP-sugar epimerase